MKGSKGADEQSNHEGDGIDTTVSRMLITRRLPGRSVLSATSESCVAQNAFSYRFNNCSATSGPLAHTDGYFQSIFLGSQQPFAIETTLITSGQHKGRFAFLVDPLRAPDDVFPLLKLPPELRTMIFEYVLLVAGIIEIIPDKHNQTCSVKAGERGKGINVGFMSVCKQIHNEVSPIFFSGNRFDLHSTKTATEFLSLIGNKVRHIQRISISGIWFVTSGTEMMRQLIQAENLKCLQIYSYFERDKIARSMYPWIRAQDGGVRKSHRPETLSRLLNILKLSQLVSFRRSGVEFLDIISIPLDPARMKLLVMKIKLLYFRDLIEPEDDEELELLYMLRPW